MTMDERYSKFFPLLRMFLGHHRQEERWCGQCHFDFYPDAYTGGIIIRHMHRFWAMVSTNTSDVWSKGMLDNNFNVLAHAPRQEQVKVAKGTRICEELLDDAERNADVAGRLLASLKLGIMNCEELCRPGDGSGYTNRVHEGEQCRQDQLWLKDYRRETDTTYALQPGTMQWNVPNNTYFTSKDDVHTGNRHYSVKFKFALDHLKPGGIIINDPGA